MLPAVGNGTLPEEFSSSLPRGTWDSTRFALGTKGEVKVARLQSGQRTRKGGRPAGVATVVPSGGGHLHVLGMVLAI